MSWMGNVAGGVYLSQLSIPGTHDSLTFDASVAAQDQDSDFAIWAQLTGGIRLFDLRLRAITEGTDIAMLVGWHGGELANTDFQQYVLEPTISFLADNPTECVLYVLTNNGDDTGQSWDAVVQTYMKAKDPGWPGTPRLFYTNNVVPTLDEVRGRIVMCVSTYGTGGLPPWGLDFSGFPFDSQGVATNTLTLDGSSPITFYVQGIYDDQEGLADPAVEAAAIQSNIKAAAANTDPRNWFITSTSRADGAPTSKAFATGWGSSLPWPAPIGYNQVALDQINSFPLDGSVGAVYSDFPNDTPGYIQAIINHNPPKIADWDSLGGLFNSQPVAVSWDTGGIVEPVFGLADDRQLYMGIYLPNNPTVEWRAVNPPPCGGVFAPWVAAVPGGPERWDVFASGTDGQVYHWHNADSGGANWEALDGCAFPLAVVASGEGRLELFTGQDRLNQKSWDGSSWGPWQDLGAIPGAGSGGPAAVAWGEGRLDVFMVAADAQADPNYPMYHKSWDGSSWSPWQDLGGNFPGANMAAVSPAAGRLDVFGLGGHVGVDDWQLYQMSWDGSSWGLWQDLGQPVGRFAAGNPTVVSSAAGRLDAFLVGSDNHVYDKSWDGSSWGPWQDLGAPPGGFYSLGSVAAVSPTTGRLDVFAVGDLDHGYRQMYHRSLERQPGSGPAR